MAHLDARPGISTELFSNLAVEAALLTGGAAIPFLATFWETTAITQDAATVAIQYGTTQRTI